MTVMFVNGRLNGHQWESPIAGVSIEHPIAFRSGTYMEVYDVIGHGMSPFRVLARYRGLRRLHELKRHFDPARLV